MNNDGCFGVVVILTITLFCVISGVSGYQEGYHAARQEAVDLGHAEWVADSTGKVSFQWRDVARTAKQRKGE